MNTYYKECFLEDIYHFEALDVWKELKPGEDVVLCLDKGDADCSKKLKVKWTNKAKDCKVLGVLSEEDSKSMLSFFKSGWDKIFSGKICFIDKESENQRIKIVVYIKDKSGEN